MTRKSTKGSVFNAIEEDAGVAEQLKIKAALGSILKNKELLSKKRLIVWVSNVLVLVISLGVISVCSQ